MRLKNSKFLAYDEYTIADIATFPWIARHEWHDIGLKKFKNLSRWYSEISSRDKVKKGYDLLKKGEEIPKSLIINKYFFVSFMFFLSFNS